MPRPYHLLSTDDREWALDHSQRAYRVRLAREEDYAGPVDAVTVTVIRLSDGQQIVMPGRDASNPNEFEDSDHNGSFYFCINNCARTPRGEAWL